MERQVPGSRSGSIPVGTFVGIEPIDFGESIENALSNPARMIHLAADATPALRQRIDDAEMQKVIGRTLSQILECLNQARHSVELFRAELVRRGRPFLLEEDRIRAQVLITSMQGWITDALLMRASQVSTANPGTLSVPQLAVSEFRELARLGTTFRMAWIETSRTVDRSPPEHADSSIKPTGGEAQASCEASTGIVPTEKAGAQASGIEAGASKGYVVPSGITEAAFCQEDDFWHLVFGGEDCRLAHAVGFTYLHRLLLSAGQEIDVWELKHNEPLPVHLRSASDPILDLEGSKLLQKEAERLASVLDGDGMDETGQGSGDEHLRAVSEELRRSGTFGSRGRRHITEHEQCRDSVRKGLKDALAKIALKAPNAHAHLRSAILTPDGFSPCYLRDETVRWILS